MTPTLIHCHMHHSSLLPLLICELSIQENSSISIYIYSNIRMINSYLCGKQLWQLQDKAFVQLFLPLVLHTPFPKLLFFFHVFIKFLSSILFLRFFSYICNTARLFYYISYYILGSLNLLNIYMLYIYI